MSDTRSTLLDLGETAIRSRGYAGFSYADLARDAGIRKASIHHHFPAKADLALALIERYAENLSADLAAIRAKNEPASSQLEQAIQYYRTALNGGSTVCLCAGLATDTALLSDKVRMALSTTNKATADWFENVFKFGRADGTINGVDNPLDEAQAALALLQGAQLLARASGSTTAFDHAVRSLRARLTS